jgi:hypothetical protein
MGHHSGMSAETIESLWSTVTGAGLDEELAAWPPDVLALTDVVLERSEAYRFAVSPPPGRVWPPVRIPYWNAEVGTAARDWCQSAEDPIHPLPDFVAGEWKVVCDNAPTSLDDIASGTAWELCEALLTLHAVADEACAGMGVHVAMRAGSGHRARGRAREMLARTGSMARIPRDRLRVLPKVRTAAGGISFRSLSRYACVRGPDVDVVWHKVPTRRARTAQQHANILLFPWPMRVRERDFRPLAGSVQRTEHEPFGFFEFAPVDPFDFDLLDRTLAAARDEVEDVDVVVMPETAVVPADLARLESTLDRHGVTILVTGVRESLDEAGGRLPSNWVHIGVDLGGVWWHYRQNKHHRWFLDRSQIQQYHLGGALHPSIRWWEAMEVPRRCVHFIEFGEGITFAAVICEDLARLDEVSDLLRMVGPTLVATPLLDGPQLASRWTARYASVLADDPGSAVLTLTAAGFARRSRPEGRPPSSVISLWKDPTGGLREIPLDPGATGVLLTGSVDRTRRRSADGRMPVDNSADLVVAGVHQVVPASVAAKDEVDDRPGTDCQLESQELTVLVSWVEAVAEAAASASEDVPMVLSDAQPGAAWRSEFGLGEPSAQLSTALGLLPAVLDDPMAVDTDPLTRLVRILMRSALDQHGHGRGSPT